MHNVPPEVDFESSRSPAKKDLLSTTPRAAVDIEDADTVDGEVVTERTVSVPPSSRFTGGGSCVPSSRLGSVPGPPEPLAELPPPVRLVLLNPPGTTAPSVAPFDQRTRCSGETPPQQLKLGP